MHSTWGNPAFRDFVADGHATVVRRLRRAGAIVVGTTNVAFMLGDFAQTANQLYGVTNNPWDMARTPGGSSGGRCGRGRCGDELPRLRLRLGGVDPDSGQLLWGLWPEAERRNRATGRFPAARHARPGERGEPHVGGRTAGPNGC